MKPNELVRALILRTGKSFRAISADCGRSGAWASVTARTDRVPSVATVADVADVAGVDVVLVDRATGETVGVVEPPRRAAMEQQQ